MLKRTSIPHDFFSFRTIMTDKLTLIAESPASTPDHEYDLTLTCVEFAKKRGVGHLYATPHGALVVFSRFPLEAIPEYDKKVFVFLAGPTPEEYCGAGAGGGTLDVHFPDCVARARYWRRQVVDILVEDPTIGSEFVFVLPEPHHGGWSVCTDVAAGMSPALHQLAWEQVMMDQAEKSGGVVGFFCWLRWTLAAAEKGGVTSVVGNCGPTTRCEVGYAYGKYTRVVAWVPGGRDYGPTLTQEDLTYVPRAQNVDWILTRNALLTADGVAHEIMRDVVTFKSFQKFVQVLCGACVSRV